MKKSLLVLAITMAASASAFADAGPKNDRVQVASAAQAQEQTLTADARGGVAGGTSQAGKAAKAEQCMGPLTFCNPFLGGQ